MPTAQLPAPITAAAPDHLETARTVQAEAILVRSSHDLLPHVPAIEELAADAAEPNVFYEPWMLLPAIDSFADGAGLIFVLIYACSPPQPAAPDTTNAPMGPSSRSRSLIAFFPLDRSTRFRKAPMSVLRLWRHSQCGLCSPLVRRGRAAEAAAAFFRWLYTGDFRTHLLEFGLIEREGEFARALKRYLARHEIPYYEADRFDRALFQPASDAESYLKRASDKRHRKDMARREKRLAAAGQMEYVRPSGAGEVDQWIRSFLDLEAAGWKGRNRTALACIAGGAAFLKRIVSEAFARNRLMMLGIRLNGRLIAAKCNLFAGTGSFAFKIAYDELYAEFSPGLLLEVENIRSLHGMREIEWMDSCAAPRHPMIDHLWPGRRAIETILVPGGKRFGGAIVTALPLLKRIKNGFRSAASVLDCRVLGRLRSHPAPGGGAANR